ncbi:hypothetical protein GEMRC1_011839 [Eukaryota sp. GEM-RC1]
MQFFVLPQNMFLITNPDVLINCTMIASALNQPFDCIRSCVLNQLYSGNEPSEPMTMGSIIHELFQKIAVDFELFSNGKETVTEFIDELLISYSHSLAACKVSYGSARELVHAQAQRIFEIIRYMKNSEEITTRGTTKKLKLDDIKFLTSETRIWNPIFGIQGKIDCLLKGKVSDSSDYSLIPVELKTSLKNLKNADLVPQPNQSHYNQCFLYCLLLSEFSGIPIQNLKSLLILLGPSNPKDSLFMSNPRIQDYEVFFAARNILAHFATAKPDIFSIKAYHLPRIPTVSDKCKKCSINDLCVLSRLGIENLPVSDIEGLRAVETKVKKGVDYDTAIFVNHFSLEVNQKKLNSHLFWTESDCPSFKLIKCDPVASITTVFDLINNNFKLTFRSEADISTLYTEGDFLWISVIACDSTDFDPLACGLAQSNCRVFMIDDNSLIVKGRLPLLLSTIELFHSFDFSCMNVSNLVEYFNNFMFRLDSSPSHDDTSYLLFHLMKFFTCPVKLKSLIVHRAPPTFETNLKFDDVYSYLTSGTRPCLDVVPGLKQALDTISGKIDLFSLNEYQLQSVFKSLIFKDYFLIFGMPGTGKSETIAHIAVLAALTNQRILLTSTSHAAVNSVFNKILHLYLKISTLPPLIRVGHPDSFSGFPQFDPFSLHNISNPDDILSKISNAKIVATTLTALSRNALLATQKFDIAIIDEASQCNFPSVFPAITSTSKLILVGDHLQLAPVTKSSSDTVQAQRDVKSWKSFDSLFCYLAANHPMSVVSLPLQYRMNQEIMNLANTLIYGEQLKSLEKSVLKQKLTLQHFPRFTSLNRFHWLPKAIDPELPVVFINTQAITHTETLLGTSIYNEVEVEVVSKVVNSLIICGCHSESIAVISPYKAQIKTLQKQLSVPIKVDTVDAFQGSEADVVVFSFVKSSTDHDLGRLLPDWRRINVAITRAKKKLIFVGSSVSLERSFLLRELIEFCKSNVILLTDHGYLVEPNLAIKNDLDLS